MTQILQAFVWIPLIGFLISMLLPVKNEKPIARLATSTLAIYIAGLLAFIIYWFVQGAPVLDSKHLVFFKSGNIEIFIDFYFDKVTAVFALVGSIITLLVIIFSRYYLHRDQGYKRFFNTTLLFFFAYNVVVFAGNFETLFMGWEVLGICSFLLIAFYRDRYLPVKNGMKVLSVYRLGDICLILAMWMSHQLWHENITFLKLNDAVLVADHLKEYQNYAVFLFVMLIIAAAIKSAQLPFSSWLPRAMEGPTTSSAIFYGSLSVHLGVFLLLRTYPYWESVMAIKVIIISLGIITSFVAAGIASVQSTVKTQIAYSSITQIGLIFIEVALGFHTLALIHFAGNALLRTYQLLVSPSVLSYLIHDMVFNFKSHKHDHRPTFFNKIKNTVYMLSVKEWNMDGFQFRFLWTPFKIIGNQFRFVSSGISIAALFLLFLFGCYAWQNESNLSQLVNQYLPVTISLVGLILILRSFIERKDPVKAWLLIIGGQFFITLSIALVHEGFGYDDMIIYLSGAFISSAGGWLCLNKLRSVEKNVDLNQFHGHSYEHSKLGFLFLLSCLGLVGFPFTPTFIGIDIVFSHIEKGQIPVIIFTALSFIFMELAVIRIYARLFMGQHGKAYHPVAFRSS